MKRGVLSVLAVLGIAVGVSVGSAGAVQRTGPPGLSPHIIIAADQGGVVFAASLVDCYEPNSFRAIDLTLNVFDDGADAAAFFDDQRNVAPRTGVAPMFLQEAAFGDDTAHALFSLATFELTANQSFGVAAFAG